MRTGIGTAIGLVLLIGCGAARAGVTATYALSGETTPLVIETGGDGTVRVQAGDAAGFGFLVRDGRSFLIAEGDAGVRVVPVDDLERAFARVPLAAGAARALAGTAATIHRRALETTITGTAAIGHRTIAGQAGVIHRVSLAIGGKAETMTIVATQAPALQPVHAAWQRMAEAARIVLRIPALTAAAPGIERVAVYLERTIALGAPLDFPGLATLRAIRFGTRPPADRFDLPAVPLGLPEIEEIIRTASPDMAE